MMSNVARTEAEGQPGGNSAHSELQLIIARADLACVAQFHLSLP